MDRKPFDPKATAAARRAANEAPPPAMFAPEGGTGEPAATGGAGGGGGGGGGGLGLAPLGSEGVAGGAAGPVRLTVSQLADRIDAAIKTGFPQRLSVVGEVSNFTDRTHWYFDLKDAQAVVACVMFAGATRKALGGAKLQHGMQVVASGRLEFYAKGGKVSFIVDKLEPVGVGALDLAFRKLCDELKALGWFAVERKRRLPTFPRKVAVVTSRTGAALQDVLNTVTRRCPAVGVVLADVRVQGDGAAAEVTAALRTIAARHDQLGIDAILVTRGGGSKEDLWTFNDREVARAIVESPIPVVAAIGHETDTTIAELVADERCATPTQAAMRLTPETPALLRQADSVRRRLAQHLAQHLRHARQNLESLARRPALSDPARLVEDARDALDASARRLAVAMNLLTGRAARRTAAASARLDRLQPAAVRERLAGRLTTLATRLDAAVRRDLAAQDPGPLAARLSRGIARTLEVAADRLTAASRQLDLVGPKKVLERGYSLTTTPDGRLIRSAAEATPGARLLTRVADGQFASTVDAPTTQTPTPTIPTSPPPQAAPPPAPSPRRKKPDPPPDQLDLFRG